MTFADRPPHEVRDNPERSRYELVVDGRLLGVADYRRHDGVVTLPHTEIKPSERGRGWGEILVRAALDDLRGRGDRVIPQCWFVAEFVDRHPEYGVLLAR